MELPERIKEERKKLNLSQDALANELHVSRQAISKWETGFYVVFNRRDDSDLAGYL